MSETARAKTKGDGPELPAVAMNLVLPKSPVMGRVAASERVTDRKSASFTRHVSIDVSGTPLAGAVRPGQSFGIIPPGDDGNGKPHKVRLYSSASPTRGEDGDGNVIATTVKRTIDEHWETGKLFLGVASNYLCDLQVGDEVALSGPNGKRFLLPARPEEHDYLFFATGTGIAPFRGMIMDMLEAGVESRIVLIVGTPYKSDLLYHADLLRWQKEHENFHYLTALSRQPQEDGHDPMYVHRRLRTHEELLMPIVDGPRGLVYICGMAGMELGIFKELARSLPDDVLEQYLSVDRELLGAIDEWERRMVPRRIKPTRRVFLEVY